jgi:hypothetical protein
MATTKKSSPLLIRLGQTITNNQGLTTLIIGITILLNSFGFPGLFIAYCCYALYVLDHQLHRSYLPTLAFLLTPILIHMIRFNGPLILAPFLGFPLFVGIIYLYQRLKSLTLSLELSTLMFLGCVVCIHLLYPNYHHAWTQQVNLLFNETQKNITAEQTTQINAVKSAVTLLKPYALGLRLSSILATCYLYFAFASFWLAHMHHTIVACTRQWHHLKLSKTSLILLLSIIGAALAGVESVYDMLPIAIIPIILSGLSLLHYFAYQKPFQKPLLFLGYLSIILLGFISITLLIMLVFIDSLMDLRTKYPQPKKIKRTH